MEELCERIYYEEFYRFGGRFAVICYEFRKKDGEDME
jgi:hypothetical protein